jgi:hypothetical protein
MLQEARKFNIAVLAETASLSGVKGVASMRVNFAQQLQTSGSPTQGTGKVSLAGQLYDAPKLPDYKDKFDPSIIREPEPDSKKQKGGLDSVLKMAESMRGLMGGMFGGLAGIALDATAAMRKQGKDDEISGAAAALGGVAIASVAVVKTFNLLDGEVQKSISRYAEYSPEITQAQAQTEMRTMLADMRRAQEHGPEIARYIEAQAELQNKWEDAKMKFMEAVMPIMEQLMNVAQMFIPFIEIAVKLMPLIELYIATQSPKVGALLLIAQVASWFRNKTEEDDTNNPFFNFDPSTIRTSPIGGAAVPGGPEANMIFG